MMRAVLACLLLIGCSAPDLAVPVGETSSGLYTVALAPDADLASETAWAVAEWQAAGGAVIVADAGVRVRFGDPPQLGQYRPTLREVVIRPGLTGDILRTTILHEVGHALGAGHTEAGLMQPTYKGAHLCVDVAAAAEIRGSSTCD